MRLVARVLLGGVYGYFAAQFSIAVVGRTPAALAVGAVLVVGGALGLELVLDRVERRP